MTPWWRREIEALARYGVRVVTQPEREPISIAEARRHLRIEAFEGSPPTHPDDDDIMGIYLPAAREWCENYSGLALATQTVEVAIGGFPVQYSGHWYDLNGLPLPIWPVQMVESITYTDSDGIVQTMLDTDYSVDPTWPGALYPAYGVTWPTARAMRNAVRMRVRVGYTLTSESPNDMPLPRSLKNAIMLVMAYLYDNRENAQAARNGAGLAEIPLAAQHLLDPYRTRLGIA